MEVQSQFLLQTQDVITIYCGLLGSINTIWNIYVFILLGMVGWIVARADQFLLTQKILLSIVFVIFNSTIIFYFYDAYKDIDLIQTELIRQRETLNLIVVDEGISGNLIKYEPINRFNSVFALVSGFGLFVMFLIWVNRIWPNKSCEG